MTQNDIGNPYSPIMIVTAITPKFDEELYPTEVPATSTPPEGGRASLGRLARPLVKRLRSLKPATPAASTRRCA